MPSSAWRSPCRPAPAAICSGPATTGRAAVELLAPDDLARHRGEWVDPISTTYRGREVLELPPNGQGGAVLAALNQLDGRPLGPVHEAETVDRTMKAVRHGMEAAYDHVADPRFVKVTPFWERRDPVYPA